MSECRLITIIHECLSADLLQWLFLKRERGFDIELCDHCLECLLQRIYYIRSTYHLEVDALVDCALNTSN